MRREKIINELKGILKAPKGYLDEGKATENLVQEYIDDLERQHLTPDQRFSLSLNKEMKQLEKAALNKFLDSI